LWVVERVKINALRLSESVIDLEPIIDKRGDFLPILVATAVVTVDFLEAAEEKEQLAKRTCIEESDLSISFS
jgi:hypothetical protein